MHRTYPSQLDGGQAYTLGLQLLMAKNLSVAVDDAALADTERVEEAARACGHNMDVHYNRVMKALQTPGRKPRATARALDKARACTMQFAAQRMSCRIRDTPRLALRLKWRLMKPRL